MSKATAITGATSLSRANYRSYAFIFTKFSELKLGDECKESYRVQIVENSSIVPSGPLVAAFDSKITTNSLELSEFVVEPYTSLKGEQLQVALQCLLHGLYKFCRVNKLKELQIAHNSSSLNEAARTVGWYPAVDRKSGDIKYLLRLAC